MAHIAIAESALADLREEVGPRFLRIAFTTGCGGSGYRLSIEDSPMDGDEVVEESGVRIALDDMASKKLDGAVLDRNELEEGFVLEHPDAVMAIWCG